MIDCLSNPSWLNPQIDFLLFLQNIRIAQPEFIDKLFLSITIFGEFWLPTLICAIVYWCIDFKAGLYLFTLEGFNSVITHFLKMLACVYRPWVLSDKIHPSKLAVPFAKGYSFPSGHSAMSSSVLGGTAFILRRKPIICILLICLILLIGFSRLWLGVHTPQDVVCGLLIGLASIFIVDRIINYAEKRQNRYLILAFILNITVALILLYICRFNTYRTDYVSGELLVNPAKSIYSTVVIYGYLLGLLNGAFLCRRFFPFDPHKTTIKNRITIGIIGSIFIVAGLKNIVGYIIMNELPTKIVFLAMFITGLFITLLYPIIFKSIDKNL
jgi:membrane-associated phospholipid phosphatase